MSTTLPRRFAGARALAGSVLPLALVAGLAGCKGADASPEEAAVVPVSVRAPAHIQRADYVGLAGEVEGLSTVNVGFMVPGQVRAVSLREGEPVQAGAPLAELDPTDYQLGLEMASAQRERAEQEMGRAQAMFEQKGIPENDLQKAQTAVRMAKTQESMAAKKLADTKLTAPISGIVARRGIEPGEQAGPGMPVFTLVQIDPVRVRVGVPEAEIDRFRVGQISAVVIPSLGGQTFSGRVRVVGVSADPASRTYTVKVELNNGDRRIRPGMIAEVRIENDQTVRAVTIPGQAIVRDADGVTHVYVYQPEEKRVHMRRVEVGGVFGTEVEISSGLTGDELVVIGGQHRVREGLPVNAQVEPTPTETPAGQAAPASRARSSE